MKVIVLGIVVVLVAVAPASAADAEGAMNKVAQTYVKLVLAVGLHDDGYVDAYYGPEEWRAEVEESEWSVDVIRATATDLIVGVKAIEVSEDNPALSLRRQYLTRQLEALIARLDMLQGVRMTFDEESQALYDAVAPTHTTEYFQATVDRLDKLLPGEGSTSERLEAFRSEFVIPKDKLDVVFTTAIDEGRKRTMKHIDLPEGENFEVEYVTDKPWSGYNWYKGNNYSLIQMNTDLPIYIDRAIDLACHEGYPGHHVYNVLLEDRLVRKRGWVEYCVYPLFSPQSLIAEGTANFGIDVAFPGDERIQYEKEVLFPLAGIDPDKAELYYEVDALLSELSYAGNEAARQYLDGKISKEEAIDWLVENALNSRERATQRVWFFETYRSYVINYNLGLDLVRNYIEAQGGTAEDTEKRWTEFEALIASPRLPSGLR